MGFQAPSGSVNPNTDPVCPLSQCPYGSRGVDPALLPPHHRAGLQKSEAEIKHASQASAAAALTAVEEDIFRTIGKRHGKGVLEIWDALECGVQCAERRHVTVWDWTFIRLLKGRDVPPPPKATSPFCGVSSSVCLCLL